MTQPDVSRPAESRSAAGRCGGRAARTPTPGRRYAERRQRRVERPPRRTAPLRTVAGVPRPGVRSSPASPTAPPPGHHAPMAAPVRSAPTPDRLDRQQEHERLHGRARRRRHRAPPRPGCAARSGRLAVGRRRLASAGGSVRRASGRARGPDPGRRFGLVHRFSSRRASPTVTTDPVISTPAPASSPSTSVLGQRDRRRRSRPADRGSTCTRSSPKISTASSAELVRRHGPRRRVPGDHDAVDHRLERLQHARHVLVGQHATTATSRLKANSSRARRPWRPCRAGCGRRRAGRSARCGPAPAGPASGRRRRRRAPPRRRAADRPPGAEERLDGGERDAPRSAPGGRRAAAGTRRRTRRRAPAASAPARRPPAARSSTPNSTPSRRRGPDLGARSQERLSAASAPAPPDHVASGLMIPAFCQRDV